MRMFRFMMLLAATVLLMAPQTGQATDLEAKGEALGQVGKALAVVKRVRAEANFQPEIEPILEKAHGVMIIPEFFKGGFIVGGAYGIGLLMVKQADGSFSQPAFYRVMEGSLGLQIGGQRAEIMLFLMTEQAVTAVMEDKMKASAGMGITVGVIGGNVGTGSTSQMEQDIYFFSLATGLYAGGALEGALIEPKEDYNSAFYGEGAAPDAIIYQGAYSHPDTADLRQLLSTPVQ